MMHRFFFSVHHMASFSEFPNPSTPSFSFLVCQGVAGSSKPDGILCKGLDTEPPKTMGKKSQRMDMTQSVNEGSERRYVEVRKN